ncbi:hypothetical protein SCLCIDRAFT_1223514, partial [Scleroderma citrinum Foug A]
PGDIVSTARSDLTGALDQKTMHGSVTRVHRLLGYSGQSPPSSDTDKIASDDYYMPIDIVISWAAEGLVLCFIHAVDDLSPADNGEHYKMSWASWCGTPSMNSQQLHLLYQQLQCSCLQPGVLTKVFQILTNSSHQDHRLIFSWPPDTSHEYSNKPSEKDFARRTEGVFPAAHDSSAKTSCTKRWRIGGTMPAINGEPPSAQHPYDISPNSYTLPPVSAPAPSYTHFSGSLASQYPTQSWSGHPESSLLLNYNRWTANDSPTNPLAPLSALCPVHESPYGILSPGRQAKSPTFGDLHGPQQGYQTTTSPNLEYIDSIAPDIVPPPCHRMSLGAAHEMGRTGNRPVGVSRCTSCKVTTSPEWRKGHSGKKELCNVCGLCYARSRAKKEGHKEKSTSLGVKQEPQLSPIVIAGATTRSSAFESGSVGSASGSEVYSQHSLVAMGSSPLPPTGNINFVHYLHPPSQPPCGVQPRNEQRPSFVPTTSFQPSSLASQLLHRGYRGNEEATALPLRLGLYGTYVSSTASANMSPAACLMPLPSHERERADDRYMPSPAASSDVKYERYTMTMR